jgi:hypothetical protein
MHIDGLRTELFEFFSCLRLLSSPLGSEGPVSYRTGDPGLPNPPPSDYKYSWLIAPFVELLFYRERTGWLMTKGFWGENCEGMSVLMEGRTGALLCSEDSRLTWVNPDYCY